MVAQVAQGEVKRPARSHYERIQRKLRWAQEPDPPASSPTGQTASLSVTGRLGTAESEAKGAHWLPKHLYLFLS